MSGLRGLSERCEHLLLNAGMFFNNSFYRQSVCRIFTQLVRAEADSDGIVEVLIDDDATAFQGASPDLPVYLEDHVVKLYGIVPVDHSLGLDRKHAGEVFAVAGYKYRR